MRRNAPLGRRRPSWWKAMLRRLSLAASGWTLLEGGRPTASARRTA